MRPKLHADVVYFPVIDGVYLRKNRGALRLKGKQIYHWLENLVPYLTGDYTLAQMTQGLDAERTAMVTHLVETLLTNQFVKDVEQDQPHQLSQQELTTYASEMNFIDSFQSSAASRFEGFRKKRVLFIGSGLSFTCLVQASLTCGLRMASVMLTAECEAVPASQPDVLDLFRKNDPAQTVQVLPLPDWENEEGVAQALEDYDVVLHISDRPMLTRACLLNRLCREQDTLFIQAVIGSEQAWVGPLVRPGCDGCWECGWRRLQGQHTNNEKLPEQALFQEDETPSISRYLVLSTAALTANRIIFELFKYVTGAGPVTIENSMIAVDLSTLTTTQHTFLAHPLCQTCYRPTGYDEEGFLAYVHQQRQQEPLDFAAFSRNIVGCIDSRLGLFTSLEEGDYLQAPLAVSQVTLAHALLPAASDSRVKLTCVGGDFESARLRVMQRACEVYAAHLCDARKLLSQEWAEQHSSLMLPLAAFLQEQPSAPGTPLWAWGMNIATGDAHLVPSSLVFPALGQELGGMRGVASGQSWDEAVCKGLFAWCAFLSTADMEHVQSPFPLVRLDTMPMTRTGLHLYDLLKTAGEQCTVYDVTATLPVPTFAICLAKAVVAYSVHCDVALALEQLLEQAVQQYQAAAAHQPAYALPAVPDLPLKQRGDYRAVSYEEVSQSWSLRLDWLVKRFRARGLGVIVVPLDHDSRCAGIFPPTVRVLLSRVEG